MENPDNKWAHKMNTEDYQVMREMISGIEIKLMGVDPLHQKKFYQFMQNVITEAWLNACNPEDSFLYPKPTSNGE